MTEKQFAKLILDCVNRHAADEFNDPPRTLKQYTDEDAESEIRTVAELAENFWEQLDMFVYEARVRKDGV